MQYFIGIVPPKEISSIVNQLRKKWGYKATEPHITIKAPVGLQNIGHSVDQIKNTIRHFGELTVSIDGVDFFNESVLFYRVHSEKIKELHFQIVKTIDLHGKMSTRFELDNYIPHLTIMKHKKGYEELPLGKIAVEASQIMQGNYVFTPQFIRIYRRQNNNENFSKFIDVYF